MRSLEKYVPTIQGKDRLAILLLDPKNGKKETRRTPCTKEPACRRINPRRNPQKNQRKNSQRNPYRETRGETDPKNASPPTPNSSAYKANWRPYTSQQRLPCIVTYIYCGTKNFALEIGGLLYSSNKLSKNNVYR